MQTINEPLPLGERIRGNYHLVEVIEIGALSILGAGILLLLTMVMYFTGGSTGEDPESIFIVPVVGLCGLPLALLALWGIYLLYIRLARLGGKVVDVLLWVGCAILTSSVTFWVWSIFDVNRWIMAKLFYRGDAPIEYAWSTNSKAARKAWEAARKAGGFNG